MAERVRPHRAGGHGVSWAVLAAHHARLEELLDAGLTVVKGGELLAREGVVVPKRTVHQLLIDDVTITKTDRIHLRVRFRGGQVTSLTIPIPPTAWQLRQSRPDSPGRAWPHRARSDVGKPFAGWIVLEPRRSHPAA